MTRLIDYNVGVSIYTMFMLRCATMKLFKIKAIKTYVSYVTTFVNLRNVHTQT